MKLLPISFFMILLSLATAGLAQTRQYSEADYAVADTLALAFLNKTNVPGFSITVSQNNTTIYSKGFGYSDKAGDIKMQPTTQIRTASVAKMITVTALGKLASEGLLDLDAPIKNYIPYINATFANLTSRQLAGHTAGIQHRPPKKNLKNKYYTSTKESVVLFDNTELLFEPDTDYRYSTGGYNFLAAVIEGASGKSYRDYMKEDIFTPLDMTQTFPEKKSDISSKDAKMYYFKKDRLVLDKTFSDGSYKLAGAGFRSTSLDLAKMMNAYSNGFIAPEVIEQMFASNTLKNGKKTNVGIGWRLNKDMQGRPTIEHAGSRQGARTVIVYYPKEKLTITIMVNAKCTLFIEETAQLIAQVFLSPTQEKQTTEAFTAKLAITSNQLDGTTKPLNGSLIITNKNRGELRIETESKWLQKSNIYGLSSSDIYAVSTPFGLIYLNLIQAPTLKGKMYQYQTQNDIFHMSNLPMLEFTASN